MPYTLSSIGIFLNIKYDENSFRPIKHYFGLLNETNYFGFQNPLISILMNDLNNSTKIIQYMAFLDFDFIDLDMLENASGFKHEDFYYEIKKLEKYQLLLLTRNLYEFIQIRFFHRKFPDDIINYMFLRTNKSIFPNSTSILTLKEVISKLASVANKQTNRITDILNRVENIEKVIHEANRALILNKKILK